MTVVSTVPTWPRCGRRETDRARPAAILGGEACPGELAARLCDGTREVWNTTARRGDWSPGGAAVGPRPGPLGLPLDGWRLAVHDPRGQPVAWGEIGELVIGGVGLGRYLDPAKDRQKYAPVPSLGWKDRRAS